MELWRTLTVQLSDTKLAASHAELVRALGQGPIDWQEFDRGEHPDAALDQARQFWKGRMLAEHRSVPVFLLLGAQLIEANASLDAKTVMLRLAQDELRHTELCGRFLAALGSEPTVDMDMTCHPLALHASCNVEERALRNVLYTTCLSEMVAVGRLVETLEHTADPVARATTRAILADEVMHGQFGFLYLDAIADWLKESGAVRESLARYLRHAFAILEEEMCGQLDRFARPSREARQLGVTDPQNAKKVFYGTIEQAVVPGLEQHGIAASRAWQTRQKAV
jgi:hypothetical protein